MLPTWKDPRHFAVAMIRSGGLGPVSIGRSGRWVAALLLLWVLSDPSAVEAQGRTPSPTADSLRAAAESGDASAQYQYGSLFVFGREGVGQNYDSAMHWFERASEQGHTGAMLSMSTMLFTSDPSRAYDWMLRAAELGHGLARGPPDRVA